MNYPLTSMAEIVGRLIRRIGLKDTSLIADLNEWIAEGMEIMRTTIELEPSFETVQSRFHKAKYPCGLAELHAVEYCGTRLRYNNGVRDPRAKWDSPPTAGDAIFVSAVTRENTPFANHVLTGTEMIKVDNLKWNALEWYKTDGRHVLTSFENGEVILYFGKVPLDANGFLMVPDHGAYKEAITTLLRARIYGRLGDVKAELAFEDRFNVWAGRAIEDITYPSVDKMQATTDALTRLLPDPNYYESFFTTTGPETPYR